MPHTHAPRDSEEALRLAIEFRGLLFLKNEKRISFRIGSPAVLDDADADRVFFERITAVVEPAGERFEVGDGEGEGRSGRGVFKITGRAFFEGQGQFLRQMEDHGERAVEDRFAELEEVAVEDSARIKIVYLEDQAETSCIHR